MRTILAIVLMLPLFILPAYAEQAPDEGFRQLEEELPDEAREISGSLKLDGGYDGEAALARLWSGLRDKLAEEVKGERREIFRVAGIALLGTLSAALCPDRRTEGYIRITVCAFAALMLAGGFDNMFVRTVGAMDQLSDYSRAAMPAVFTAAAACGAAVSAPARYGAVCLALDVMMRESKQWILPLIRAFLAVSIAAGIYENSILRAISALLKKTVFFLMTGTTALFTAYIGLTGIVTASTDAAAVKTTKTVISSVLPVVGNILSDAAGAVLSAASVIKNAAGVFALIAISALCIGPFAMLGVKLLLFRLSAAAANMLPGSGLGSLLEQMSTVMSMLLGLLGCHAVMLFFSLMSAIRVVAPC